MHHKCRDQHRQDTQHMPNLNTHVCHNLHHIALIVVSHTTWGTVRMGVGVKSTGADVRVHVRAAYFAGCQCQKMYGT